MCGLPHALVVMRLSTSSSKGSSSHKAKRRVVGSGHFHPRLKIPSAISTSLKCHSPPYPCRALALLTHTVLYHPREGTALGGSPHPHTVLSCIHVAADLSCQLFLVTQVSAQRSPLQRGHPDPLSRRNPSSSLVPPALFSLQHSLLSNTSCFFISVLASSFSCLVPCLGPRASN